MLTVLGVGASVAETILSNQFLAELGEDAADADHIKRLGINSRRSSLPVSYIRDTGNADPRAAKAAAIASPTDLAHRAASQALSQAGITAEQLGLILGDCSTPHQVTPAEGQRLAEKFALKIPSYDLFTTAGPIPGHLDVLASWAEERLPEYALLFSSNTPTLRANFRRGLEAHYLGDGAGAMVLSARHRGKLALKDVASFYDSQLSGVISFDAFDHAIIPRASESRIHEIALEMGKTAIAANNLDPSKIKFIGPEFTVVGGAELATELGVSPQNHWSLLAEVGNTLGASPILNLAARWDEIRKGDQVVCVQVGVGVSYGYAVFEGL
ncbi:MAG: hypothetical protein EBZ48_05940 [Proteobacteria bacterium]|nr:hypothetical protein [Pseudomonadota bacterium]